MTLSIIIPTYKRADQAAKLLDSIAEQEFPYEDLQVLLISNLRDKKLRKQIPHWRSLFFDFKYKEVGDVGVNKARNMGIRFAGGDILYFLDDDCLLPNKHHLQSLILEHKQNPSAIGIGGGYKSMEFLYGSEKFYHEHSQKWIEDFVSSQKETSQLVGGNASYKRGVFDKGFYFDPLIIFGGSEESFNQSLKKESYTLLYSEKLWVFHLIKLKWFSLAKKSFGQGFGLFTSRYQSGQTIQSLQNMKTDWAFSVGKFSFYPFIYTLFFKLGYFWGASFFIKKNFIFRFFYFVLLLIKSRLYFLKEYFIPRFYGSVILRYLGALWYVLWYVLGKLWYMLGKLWYMLGKLWYVLGWIYGHVLLFVFHHSPPMKVYYFSKYQYYKRIKPFLSKIKASRK